VELNVPTQVDKLIEQAHSLENLCILYVGWCPVCPKYVESNPLVLVNCYGIDIALLPYLDSMI
jgi:hypothetical protein